MEQFAHLGLTQWPFPVVPEPKYCTFLAARAQLRKDVETLLSSLSRRDTSSIHLFWSWFGAGKTHTLYYLANRAQQTTNVPRANLMVTAYSEFPKAARGFIDLYRSFVFGLDMELLVDAYLEITTCAKSNQFTQDLREASYDLFTALHVIATGQEHDRISAIRWLRADPLPVSEFRKIGIGHKIKSEEEASRILAALVNLFKNTATARGRPGSRVLWLLDEFQRIERTGTKIINEINAGLHSTFNACPRGLSLVLSFSGKPQANLPSWFSLELLDRIGATKVMILPPMLPEEALEFVQDVLAQFRPPEFDSKETLFPFTQKTCEAIIEQIDQHTSVKPRSIMQAFNAVLEEADPLIEREEMEFISPEFAQAVLSERIVLSEEN